jgi:hypothetical protein
LPEPQAAPLLMFMHTPVVVLHARHGLAHEAGHAETHWPFWQALPPPQAAPLLMFTQTPVVVLHARQGPVHEAGQAETQAPL